MNGDHHPVGRPSGESGTMTPPINSVSPERLAQLILQLRENIRLMESRLAKSAIPEESWDTAPALEDARLKLAMATELAARRAANTPVGGWVMVPRDATESMVSATYALSWDGDDEAAFAHNMWNVMVAAALPSQVVGVSLADAATALERSLESEGAAVNAYLRDDIEQAIAAMRSCLTSPAAEPDYWAVWSATGTHIGTWPDKADAEKALQDYEWPTPKLKGSIKSLYTHPAPSASREVTVTDEMVERAARNIAKRRGEMSSWDDLPPSVREDYLFDARAALLAALPEREGKNGW